MIRDVGPSDDHGHPVLDRVAPVRENQWCGFIEFYYFLATCGVNRTVTPPLIVVPAPLSSVVAIV